LKRIATGMRFRETFAGSCEGKNTTTPWRMPNGELRNSQGKGGAGTIWEGVEVVSHRMRVHKHVRDCVSGELFRSPRQAYEHQQEIAANNGEVDIISVIGPTSVPATGCIRHASAAFYIAINVQRPSASFRATRTPEASHEKDTCSGKSRESVPNLGLVLSQALLRRCGCRRR